MNSNSGIYFIINNDDKFYIGSTENFIRRKKQHFDNLKAKRHKNNHLQNAWNKYGEENFKFEIIQFCDPKDLLKIEQKYLDKYWDNCKNCYNISQFADSPMRGSKHTEETKRKLKISRNTRGPYSEVTKKKMSLSQLGHQRNIGRKHSDKAKEKIKLNNARYWLGKTQSKDHKEKLSKIRLGKKRSKETNKKISLSMMKDFNFKSPIGEIFTGKGIKDFSIKFDLNSKRMSDVMNDKRKSHKGWTKSE